MKIIYKKWRRFLCGLHWYFHEMMAVKEFKGNSISLWGMGMRCRYCGAKYRNGEWKK